jgi:hypothetical protein
LLSPAARLPLSLIEGEIIRSGALHLGTIIKKLVPKIR